MLGNILRLLVCLWCYLNLTLAIVRQSDWQVFILAIRPSLPKSVWQILDFTAALTYLQRVTSHLPVTTQANYGRS